MAEEAGVFTGKVEPFDNFSHAELGSVVVVLRNGKPHSVHAPGKRLVRGLGLPMWGDLQAVQIRTTPLVVHQTIQNIATTEPASVAGQERNWEIESLSLGLSVQINPDGDYRAFRDHVRRFGPAFGRALLEELAAGTESLVRRRLGPMGHAELYTASLPQLLLPEKQQSIGDGALVLVSLVVESVAWSRWFMQERSGKAETDATVALQLHRTIVEEQARVTRAISDANVQQVQSRADEQVKLVQLQTDTSVRTAQLQADTVLRTAQLQADTALRTAQVQADALMLNAGLDVYAEPAARLGISPYDLLHPERLQLRQDRAERLLKMLSEPGIRAYFQRDPAVLDALVAQASGALRASLPGSGAGRTSEEGPRAVGAPMSEPLELNRTLRLHRAVTRANPASERLTGLAAGSDGTRAIVLLVATEPVVEDAATPAITAALAPLLHVERVTVVVLVARSLDEVVSGWFEAVHPGSNLRLSTAVDDQEVVVIELSGDVTAARRAVEELNQPGEPAMQALSELLPFAAVTLRLGS